MAIMEMTPIWGAGLVWQSGCGCRVCMAIMEMAAVRVTPRQRSSRQSSLRRERGRKGERGGGVAGGAREREREVERRRDGRRDGGTDGGREKEEESKGGRAVGGQGDGLIPVSIRYQALRCVAMSLSLSRCKLLSPCAGNGVGG